jgi:HlyD family secretion protein
MNLRLPRRRVIAAAFLLVLICAGAAASWHWWIGRHAAPRYVTQAVTRGDIERSVTMTGTVDPVTTVQIGSYVSGIVKSLGCDFNTEVKVGQVCARIDPEPFRLVVEQNRADLATTEAHLKKDQAALTYAKLSLARDAKLLEGGVVSADQVDSDRNTEAQAEAQIALDQASLIEKRAVLQGAEVNLGYTDIVSPVEGTVITRNVDIGQTVVSNLQSSTLFVIAKDLTKMQVDTNVAEADIAAVKVGQSASFTVQAFPDKQFTGTVRQIRQAPITVQSVVTYDVVVAVDNPGKLLLPGMTADTHIITAEARGVLRVPLPAIRFVPADVARRRAEARAARPQGQGGEHQGGWEHERRGPPGARVWVLRDDQLTAVPVKVGLDDGTLVEVSSDALKPGDRVVVSEAHETDPQPTPQRRSGNFGQQRRAPIPGGGHF